MPLKPSATASAPTDPARSARARVGRAARTVPRCPGSHGVQPADERARDSHGCAACRRAARADGARPRRHDARSRRRTTSPSTCTKRCARPDSPTATSSSSRRGRRCSPSDSPRRRRSRSPRARTRMPGPRIRTTGCSPPCSACVPASSGFSTVSIAPKLGTAAAASGSVPHPRGDIDVQFTRQGAKGLKLRVTLPAGLTGVCEWQGRKVQLKSGTQELNL